MGSLIEQHVLNWRNRSWAVTAQIEVPDGGGLGKGGTATLRFIHLIMAKQ
jgi:hypothetical protein